MPYTAGAWREFGVRLWHPADLAVLDDDIWQGMKRFLDTRGSDAS